MENAPTEKVPPIIRSARFVCDNGYAHVDNFTGALVHDKKVERALAAMGLPPIEEMDEHDADDRRPIVIKRSHGGPKINAIMLDGFTASMLVQVWEKLSPENRVKLAGLIERRQVVGFVNFCWKLIK